MVVRTRNIFLTLREISRFVCAKFFFMNFEPVLQFIFSYCVIFSENFALFLVQNFKTKFLTTQKIYF